jgi:beta-galactosidase
MKNSINFFVLLLITILFAGCIQNASKRTTISLNGIWQIADGKKDIVPAKFERNIPVPGLIIQAQPAFLNPAPKLADRFAIDRNTDLFYHQQDSLRETYWYHRTFRITQNIHEVALLKVGKAMFGTRVYLNGTFIGEHLPCFTPGYFDLRKALKKGENELIIAVGSCRNSLPQDVPDGFDYEKERYISGIFDNVDLILSRTPYISNVQIAPDIKKKVARIQAILYNNEESTSSKITFVIKEAKTGIVAGEYKTDKIIFDANRDKTIDVEIPIKDCILWSPESPFLYTLEVSTKSDFYKTRFGMRELRFDSLSHHAILNGKPYFLRGTNITLYRFFEDPACGDLPWNYDWVRTMHQKFKKDMFYNSYRNCIGFPPEEWYNIADEEGFMIQDEFPIWYGGPGWNKWVKNLNSDELALEYKEWMQERWNHPSVVIWDANNETQLIKPSIDSAIAKVRSLDLSGRSWDNSYSNVRSPGDIFESHPYHFSDADFKFKDIARASIIPEGNALKNPGNYPVIINEYGWLWLNRDGSTTTLTSKLYENLIGKNSTAQERWKLYAEYIAAETEFWRCHRKAAGVLHFTGLGYARPNGQTCDNWIDLEKLTWEPQFYTYMHNAFSPIGLMIDFWDETIKTGIPKDIPVITINDTEKDWQGKVMLQVLKSGVVVQEYPKEITIPAFGQSMLSFSLDTDLKKGNYTIEVFLFNTPFGTIKSIRKFSI